MADPLGINSVRTQRHDPMQFVNYKILEIFPKTAANSLGKIPEKPGRQGLKFEDITKTAARKRFFPATRDDVGHEGGAAATLTSRFSSNLEWIK